jgi:dihydrofolate reductase
LGFHRIGLSGALTAASLVLSSRSPRLARERGESEVFICGGAEIYAQSIVIVDRMYLTFIDAEVEADTFFPKFDEREWVERESFYQPADEKNQYPFTFRALVRRSDY